MTTRRTVLAGLTGVALALALSATPALAGNGKGRGRGHDKHDRGHRHERVYRDHDDGHRYRRSYDDDHYRRPVYRSFVRERFVVPHRIVRASVYDRYFSGEVWFAPHRHAHVVYAFPVYTPYGVEYEPSYYCDHHLYVERSGRYYDRDYDRRRPRVQIGVHLGF